MPVHPSSVLFVTLDSCRFDTFRDAQLPHMKAIGPLHEASAPGNFTYASHAAMFVGFTPGIPEISEAYVNPKFGRIFRLVRGGSAGAHEPFFSLQGRDIVAGFRHAGYRAIGTGAAGWFDTSTSVSRNLTKSFDSFLYAGDVFSFARQRTFLLDQLGKATKPVFAFLNVGETHVPYWHEGAAWNRSINPCRSFAGPDNDAEECRRRQMACVEWVDREIKSLLDEFEGANVVICADHGDAWGEDGLWEHGIHHPSVLQVPLLFRLLNPPPEGTRAELGESPPARVAAKVIGQIRARQALGRPGRH